MAAPISKLVLLAMSLPLVACGPPTVATPSSTRPADTQPLSADASAAAADVMAPPTRREGPIEELVRTRCATDETDVYTQWTGNAYAYLPGQRPQLVFELVGMNVARCMSTADGWRLTSRELMYYLDPKTGEVLDRWTNPWIGDDGQGVEVPVVHVANDPVQMPLGRGGFEYEVAGGTASFQLDVPLFYPNALGKDPRFADYSPQPDYQAGEFFMLVANAAEIQSPDTATASWMSLSWHRVSPWLPWMKMGDRPGYLVFSARGSKVGGFEQLPEILRRDIEQRLPRYRTAPSCWLDTRNETSWSYFARHFDAYRAGERFPLPAPAGAEICKDMGDG